MHTVDLQEIQNFSKDSASWWDETGPFAPLHRLNPVRMAYIRAQIDRHFRKDPESLKPFEGLTVLDAGCGGGLVCESMSRLGASVTGIDADGQAIEVARDHAEQAGLNIDYRKGSTEDLLTASPSLSSGGEAQNRFDIVLALEIAEHVADVDVFVDNLVDLCKPGGIVILSTLNRTARSFALGIVAAEYILRWVPRGTHSWKKFIRPAELSGPLRRRGLKTTDITGLIYDPFARDFRLSKRDVAVNYFLTAAKD